MEVKDMQRVFHRLGGEKSIFEAADEDVSGTTQYFGYVNSEGYWMIQRINTTTGTIRWISGTSSYPAAWTNRAALTYGYYYAMFPTA